MIVPSQGVIKSTFNNSATKPIISISSQTESAVTSVATSSQTETNVISVTCKGICDPLTNVDFIPMDKTVQKVCVFPFKSNLIIDKYLFVCNPDANLICTLNALCL